MGVYIKGLKIPPSGACIFALTSSGMAEDAYGLVVGEAVEAKAPHGRLGDLDALKAEIIRTYEYEFPTATGAFDEFATLILPNIINNAPTIIEAEGKDDEP